jgi:hypothetical protein
MVLVPSIIVEWKYLLVSVITIHNGNSPYIILAELGLIQVQIEQLKTGIKDLTRLVWGNTSLVIGERFLELPKLHRQQ